MKKGVFLIADTMAFRKAEGIGVYKKINAQMDALRERYDIQLIEAYYKKDVLRKILSRLPGFPNMFSYHVNSMPAHLDFLYFREEYGDMYINRFLSRLKKKQPRCKIIVEFPCYPLNLDVLIHNWTMLPFRYKHLASMKTLYRYVDRFVMLGDVVLKDHIRPDQIIKTTNGINIHTNLLRKVMPYDGCIHIISVSHMMYWHRIDRMLRGMAQYYANGGTREICFHLVGDGWEKENLIRLTCELGLQDRVIFYGTKTGDALNGIYDLSDISLDALYDKHMILNSLKSRESWAKGLPIITSSDYEPDTTPIKQYIYKVPLNSEPIQLDRLISFYDGIYGNNSMKERLHVAHEIRQFATTYCSMEAAMKPIFDYIEE